MNDRKVPIMLLFFNRADTLKEVFAWVRKMQPEQLFLVQDGPRADRPDDIPKIEACRKVVENIDWPCQVYRNYAEQNMSCDHREFTGISWCFEHVDRLLILEDDCVPADSFYSLCGDLLERYKDDNRVFSISGFNRLGNYEKTPYDYVFSNAAAGIGWATWKRCWDHAQSLRDMDFLNDAAFMQYYEQIAAMQAGKKQQTLLQLGKRVRALDIKLGKVSSWEFLAGLSAWMNHQVIITPRVNMVQYIGITADATHSTADAALLSHKVRRVLLQPSRELEGELKHPPILVRDVQFEQENDKAVSSNRLLVFAELLWLRIQKGQWKSIGKAISKRICKGKKNH